MADLNVFSFKPGQSILHRLDPRVKLLGMMLISLLSLGAGGVFLATLSVLLIVLMADCELSLVQLVREVRYFLFLLLLVFVARVLSTPGETVWQWHLIAVSAEGIQSGFLVCWRLLIVIISGLLLVISTRTSRITAAVRWYLRPAPLVNETRVALMMGLVVRFIPGLLQRTAETADAQRARCVENRKNPVYRLQVLVIPLLRNIFLEADELVQAMQARGYTGRRTEPAFRLHRGDWIAMAILGSLVAALIYLNGF
jgi:energy-coupling factor transporter transmembrane protein EcfT